MAHISPKGKPLGSYTIGLEHLVHPDNPIVFEWTRGDRVHRKSSARKVTHSNTIPALCNLTLDSWSSHRIWIKTFSLSHPGSLSKNLTFKMHLDMCKVILYI